jgi:hypothetical protein
MSNTIQKHNIILTFANHTRQRGKSKILETITGSKSDAIQSIKNNWCEMFDDDYFENEDGMICDASGNILFEIGDERIGDNDKWIYFESWLENIEPVDPLMTPIDLNVAKSIDIYNPELLQNARKMLILIETIKMWQPVILERLRPGVESEIFRDILIEMNDIINYLNESK